MTHSSAFALLGGSGVPVSGIPARLFYSPRETEAILGISHATCYRLIAAGKLDARKLGGKTGITAESISALAASLPKIGEAA